MWTLQQGLKTVRLLQAELKSCAVHFGVTGGVLLNDESWKDLDLIIYPNRQGEWDPFTVRNKIKDFFGTDEVNKCDGESPSCTQDRDGKSVWWLVTRKGKRVDIFFLQ